MPEWVYPWAMTGAWLLKPVWVTDWKARLPAVNRHGDSGWGDEVRGHGSVSHQHEGEDTGSWECFLMACSAQLLKSGCSSTPSELHSQSASFTTEKPRLEAQPRTLKQEGIWTKLIYSNSNSSGASFCLLKCFGEPFLPVSRQASETSWRMTPAQSHERELLCGRLTAFLLRGPRILTCQTKSLLLSASSTGVLKGSVCILPPGVTEAGLTGVNLSSDSELVRTYRTPHCV